jgi:hypothetical protein
MRVTVPGELVIQLHTYSYSTDSVVNFEKTYNCGYENYDFDMGSYDFEFQNDEDATLFILRYL